MQLLMTILGGFPTSLEVFTAVFDVLGASITAEAVSVAGHGIVSQFTDFIVKVVSATPNECACPAIDAVIYVILLIGHDDPSLGGCIQDTVAACARAVLGTPSPHALVLASLYDVAGKCVAFSTCAPTKECLEALIAYVPKALATQVCSSC